MANRNLMKSNINDSAQRSLLNHTKNLGRTAAGAMALAMFLPAVAVSASAATSSEAFTIEDIATVSVSQIKVANSAPAKFSSADLIDRAAIKIEEDRKERDRIREEARIAEEARLAEEARIAEEAAAAERAAAAAAAAKVEAAKVQASRASAKKPEPAVSQPKAALPDVPLASGAEGVVAAAKAQLGVAQDCTDLVQNTLAAVGLTTRRDQGGYDLGTGIWQYDKFGPRVSLDAIVPGDILVYGNAGSGTHVSIYIGDGKAVHGGHNGSTVIASMHSAYQAVTGAIRPGV